MPCRRICTTHAQPRKHSALDHADLDGSYHPANMSLIMQTGSLSALKHLGHALLWWGSVIGLTCAVVRKQHWRQFLLNGGSRHATQRAQNISNLPCSYFWYCVDSSNTKQKIREKKKNSSEKTKHRGPVPCHGNRSRIQRQAREGQCGLHPITRNHFYVSAHSGQTI